MDKNEQFIEFLKKNNFAKHLKKLSKKLKDKKIILYGSGKFFEVLNSQYDLSGLNIIAIADKKFDETTKQYLGYKTCTPNDIIGLSPDFVLVSIFNFIDIIEYLAYDLLKNSTIKIKPLVKIPFIDLLKKIWSS